MRIKCKLIKVGNKSLMVVIPTKIVEGYGWKAGNIISVELDAVPISTIPTTDISTPIANIFAPSGFFDNKKEEEIVEEIKNE